MSMLPVSGCADMPEPAGSVEQPPIHAPAETPPARRTLKMVIFVRLVFMSVPFCNLAAPGTDGVLVRPPHRATRTLGTDTTHVGDTWAPSVRGLVTTPCHPRERRSEIGEGRRLSNSRGLEHPMIGGSDARLRAPGPPRPPRPARRRGGRRGRGARAGRPRRRRR